jgi:hypothetical protein
MDNEKFLFATRRHIREGRARERSQGKARR